MSQSLALGVESNQTQRTFSLPRIQEAINTALESPPCLTSLVISGQTQPSHMHWTSKILSLPTLEHSPPHTVLHSCPLRESQRPCLEVSLPRGLVPIPKLGVSKGQLVRGVSTCPQSLPCIFPLFTVGVPPVTEHQGFSGKAVQRASQWGHSPNQRCQGRFPGGGRLEVRP